MTENEFAWRLVDANLNRAAEGLRVVEDVLRFGFEDSERCAESRALRHQLRDNLKPVYPKLIAWRRVDSDPGVQISFNQGMDGKADVKALLLANLKRTQEGMRVMEESLHLLGYQMLAKDVEHLRYKSYRLEAKLVPYYGLEIGLEGDLQRELDLGLQPEPRPSFMTGPEAESLRNRRDASEPKQKPKLPVGLYALTSEPHSLGRSNIEVVDEMLKAGVKIIQYREKKKKFGAMHEECLRLREMTREAGALLIINDYVALAQAVGADGVHIGQDDLPLAVVRELLGPNSIIGVSTHSPEQAQAAVAGGADYIGVGPLFSTATKENVCAPVGLEYLDYVVEHLDIPFVAIGGIKQHNLTDVMEHGAKTVALVTEIVGSRDIQGVIRNIRTIME